MIKTYFTELVKILNSHKKVHDSIANSENEPITRSLIISKLNKKIPFPIFLNGKIHVPTTIDTYRLMLTKVGYLKSIKSGIYIVVKLIPTDLTTTQLKKEYKNCLENEKKY